MSARTCRPLTSGDATWRFRGRGMAKGYGTPVDGQECYMFQRSGGVKATDVMTTYVIPVATFWGGKTRLA